MTKIIPSDILIDKAHVLKQIGKAGTLEELRFAAMPAVSGAYAHARDMLKQRFLLHGKSPDFVAGYALAVDMIIQMLWEIAKPHLQHDVAIIAVGGYGRSELFPHSDIDLLFLYENEAAEDKAFVSWMLYCLWDLNLNIGHAIRTVDETLQKAQEDITIRTSLLDARLVCGHDALFSRFTKAFDEYIENSSTIEFVEAKLAERDARHQRMGDSRYVLEPNIKEGKGGLRDLHTLIWLVKYIYRTKSPEDFITLKILTPEEYKAFSKAEEFLWQVRIHLHFIAGRAEERLTFDMQRQVALALGYQDDSTSRFMERFMKQYFLAARNVGSLTRSVCAVLEENGKRKPRVALARRMQQDGSLGEFHLDGERLAVASDDSFRDNPLLLITLFQTAHEHNLDIHPHTMQLVTRSLWLVDAALRRNDAANEAFMQILLSKRNPEPTLRRMSEAGVLGKFIPDFGRVTGQMQFDMYHVYTVDEHTIFALGIIHNIGAGKYADEFPLASQQFKLVKSPRVLFLSLLAHDIAKGRGGNHSVLGEVIVRKLARRFRFDEYEAETCAWLVRQHLLMSRTAFKRDLHDSKTIEDFVEAVQSPERLRLLLLLTVADIRAVGPNVWNGWKGALLRELYYAAEEKMGVTDRQDHTSEIASLRTEMIALLPGWKPEHIDEYLDQVATSFGSSFDAATHARIARVLREVEHSGSPLVLDTRSDTFRAISDMILCTNDSPGLFSRTSGAIALAGATIVSSKIFTLKNGIAIQMFHIQDTDGTAFDKPDKLARLSVFMNRAVEGTIDLEKEIAAVKLPYPSRTEAFKVPPHVYIENKLSTNHTVIEVTGRDRVGFLYRVTKVLSDLHLTISTAHITTYGERAVDVFYVKDAFGMKIFHDTKIRQIQDLLIAALSAGPDKTKK